MIIFSGEREILFHHFLKSMHFLLLKVMMSLGDLRTVATAAAATTTPVDPTTAQFVFSSGPQQYIYRRVTGNSKHFDIH